MASDVTYEPAGLEPQCEAPLFPLIYFYFYYYSVASDVAYEPAVFEPLCEALRAVCSQAHTKVLLCNGVRSSTREKV